MSQHKSNTKSSSYDRLQRLRLVTGKTWQQVADELKLDRSMFFHVKAGTRNLSEKALFRLRQAELAAGINYSARELIELGLSPMQTAGALSEQDSVKDNIVTMDDIDKGFVDLEVDYRRGDVPRGRTRKIRVTAPSNEKVLPLAGQIKALLTKPGPLLSLCLSPDQLDQKFLDQLTPASYKKLIETAMAMTFGLHWRNELKA